MVCTYRPSYSGDRSRRSSRAQEFQASLGNTARAHFKDKNKKPYPLSILGCKDVAQGQLLKELMQTPNFRITVVQEVDTVEICGALKVRGYRGGFGVGS